MKTFGGYLRKGNSKMNFEISAPNKRKAYDGMKHTYPDWEVQITESHKSVYKGKFGHPKLTKYKRQVK